jgi:L-fucose isomerase-like protein
LEAIMNLKIGLAGAVHINMPGDDRALFAQVSGAMKEKEKDLDYELVLWTEILTSEEGSEKALRYFREQGVDLILLFCASLPYGRAVLPFAEFEGALGIWSVPEPAGSGVLQLNSYCGLNMFGSILKNYFPDRDIRYKWFYGMPDAELFIRRLDATVRALKAVKKLKGLRIGQVGDLADGFENLYVDERVLYDRLGTKVYGRHTVEEIVRRAESCRSGAVEEEIGRIRAEGRCVTPSVSALHMEKAARINLALADFALENRYDALAVSCWSRFQEVYDVAVCGAMSRLNQMGVVAPCEADISSAVSMVMLGAMGGGPASLNDMVALDEADTSLALWHCGVAPGCWADEKGVAWDGHFNIGHYEGKEWVGSGVVADMNFKGGLKTVCTIRNDFSSLFLLTGESLPDKKGYAGSGGWLGELKVNGRSVTIPDLINTISVGRVNHHYPAAFGDLSAAVNEFAFWTGMKVQDAVPCTDYMTDFSD